MKLYTILIKIFVCITLSACSSTNISSTQNTKITYLIEPISVKTKVKYEIHEPSKDAVIVFDTNDNLAVFFAEFRAFNKNIEQKYPNIHSISVARSLAITDITKEKSMILINKIKHFDRNSFDKIFATTFNNALSEYAKIKEKSDNNLNLTKHLCQISSEKYLTKTYFEKIYRIYDAILPRNYILTAYIIPNLSKNPNNIIIGNNLLIVNKFPGSIEDQIAIVGKECCDIAFNKMSPELRARIDRFLTSKVFTDARIDNDMMNAILSSTFGIAIVNDLSGNKSSHKEKNHSINKISNKLLPIAKNYYNKNRVLDETFFLELTKIIKEVHHFI